MLVVQDDWIQYEAMPARRPAVRGGAACAQRIPVASTRLAGPALPSSRGPAPTHRRTPASVVRNPVPRLRLTRRGRVVVALLPVLCAVSVGLAWLATPTAQAAPRSADGHAVVLPE